MQGSTDGVEEAVRRYINGTDFKIREIAGLAPGVIGVFDTTGEWDAYFDREFWAPQNPALWGESLYPPGLEGTGLGVLQGIGRAPQPRNFKGLRNFAECNLMSREGRHVWFAQHCLPL